MEHSIGGFCRVQSSNSFFSARVSALWRCVIHTQFVTFMVSEQCCHLTWKLRVQLGHAYPTQCATIIKPNSDILFNRYIVENLVVVTARNRSAKDKMREIIHLQAGQCGNQIGSKVKNVYKIYIYNRSHKYNASIIL